MPVPDNLTFTFFSSFLQGKEGPMKLHLKEEVKLILNAMHGGSQGRLFSWCDGKPLDLPGELH